MAVRAGIHLARGSKLVRTDEGEAGGAVIERRRKEADRVVAIRAVRRRKGGASRRVIRIVRSLPSAAIELGEVAPGVAAIRRLNRQSGIVSVVALVATCHQSSWRNLMRIRQREPGVRMIERRIRPQDRIVALAAK